MTTKKVDSIQQMDVVSSVMCMFPRGNQFVIIVSAGRGQEIQNILEGKLFWTEILIFARG